MTANNLWFPRQDIQINNDEAFPTAQKIRFEDGDGVEFSGEFDATTNTAIVRAQLGESPGVVVSWKNAVDVANENNFAGTVEIASDGARLTASGNGALAAIDGVSLSVGQDALFFGQTDPSQNGIWRVTDVGSVSTPARWQRRSDAYVDAQVTSQMRVPVAAGAEYRGAIFTLTTPDLIAVDSTELTFSPDFEVVGGELGWRRGFTLSAEATTTDAEPTARLISFAPPNSGPVGWACTAMVRAYEVSSGKVAIIHWRQSFLKIGSGVPVKLNSTSGDPIPAVWIDGTGADAVDVGDLLDSLEWDVDENSIVLDVASPSGGSGPTVRWCAVAQFVRL